VPIVDSGSLYAAAATRDEHHRRCVELLSKSPGPLVVPALVVTEVVYLLADRIGSHAELAFARAIRAGELVLARDWGRIEPLTE
jgi:predicted nucleic acid-binding protein